MCADTTISLMPKLSLIPTDITNIMPLSETKYYDFSITGKSPLFPQWKVSNQRPIFLSFLSHCAEYQLFAVFS